MARKKIDECEGPVAVKTLSKFMSNPLKVCQELQKKGFIHLFQKNVLPNTEDLFFPSIQKKIIFNKDQKKAINKINSSIQNKKYNS